MINIAIYKDKETFLKCFPNKTEKDFEEYNNPIYQIIINLAKYKEETYRFCIIDESFFNFMKENKLENIEASLITYINEMPNSNAEKLWKKNKYIENTEMMLYPFLILTEHIDIKTNYKLSDTQRKTFQEIISKLTNINISNIYVPGYISSFEKTIDYGDSLISIGNDYFYKNKIINYKIFEEQENPEGFNIYTYCIPVFFKKDFNYIITKDFLSELFTEKEFDFKFDHEEIKKLINLDQVTVPLTDFLVYTEDLMDIYEDIVNLIEKKTKKKNFFSKFFKNKKSS